MIIQKSSPNFASGRGNYKPEIIVIHIMDGTLEGTDSWFANPKSQVSSHYGLGWQGEIHQYVQEKDTAWHAGRVLNPCFNLYKPGVNPNLYTIGIEHEGKADSVWSDSIKQASASLIREVCNRWAIPIDREHIIGHYQVFANKPNCPAQDKQIIDELVTLANNSPTAQAIKLIEQALNLLKQ
jgi:N-acetylmuramoyl-L-alanine amidase